MRLPRAFREKAYRDEFVSAGIDNGISFQLFAMREQRQWSQERLAAKLGKLQPQISGWERPGHRFSLATLKKIASAFDVALIVRFVPFSELANWTAQIRPGALEVPSFTAELMREEQLDEGVTTESLPPDKTSTYIPVDVKSWNRTPANGEKILSLPKGLEGAKYVQQQA